MGKELAKPNSCVHSSPSLAQDPPAGDGTSGGHTKNLATGGQPSKAMAQGLQSRGRLLEAKIKKLMAERGRPEHRLFSQTSGSKETIQGSYKSSSLE